MNTYQVIRSFPGSPEVGAILSDADFFEPMRAAALVGRRYLKRVETADQTGQPTVAQLLAATVRQLTTLLPRVADACVVEAALAQETRESAIKAMTTRLAEMKA